MFQVNLFFFPTNPIHFCCLCAFVPSPGREGSCPDSRCWGRVQRQVLSCPLLRVRILSLLTPRPSHLLLRKHNLSIGHCSSPREQSRGVLTEQGQDNRLPVGRTRLSKFRLQMNSCCQLLPDLFQMLCAGSGHAESLLFHFWLILILECLTFQCKYY